MIRSQQSISLICSAALFLAGIILLEWVGTLVLDSSRKREKNKMNKIEYWDLTTNPIDETYQALIKVLCDHSDTFYFITRKELSYDQDVLAEFKQHIIESYQTKEWANTITMGPPATVYLMESNEQTCKLLQQHANGLYDWVAPNLPEDLTFIKNSFTWFSSTTHEEFGGFSIRSDYYRQLIHTVPGLKIQRIE